jgi:tripartite-type tricarboxylate transporter receptor subunit TctC
VVKEKLGSLGYDLVGGTPKHFATFVRNEIKKWAGVVKRTEVKID